MQIVAAHELGRCFELQHNAYENEKGKTFLMKASVPVRDNPSLNLSDYQLGIHEFHWLSQHLNVNVNAAHFPTAEIVSKSVRADEPGYVKLIVEIKGQGLHYAQISRTSDNVVIGWDKLQMMRRVIKWGRPDLEYTDGDTAEFRFKESRLDTDEVWIRIMDFWGGIYRDKLTVDLSQIPELQKNDASGRGVVGWANLKEDQ